MLHIQSKFKPLMLLLPVGLCVALVMLLGVALSTGHPVQAQPPADEVYPPELLAMEPRAVLQDETMLVSVNYATDIVEDGYYTTGHTIMITVTNAAGQLKATAQVQSGTPAHWGGAIIGYSTFVGNPWVPARPDIQPGDWVNVTSVEGGISTEVQVGAIVGNLDPGTQTVSGTIDAEDVMPDFVDVLCRIYGPEGLISDLVYNLPRESLLPDGADVYTCNFTGVTNGEFIPGRVVGISYNTGMGDERGNRVSNIIPVTGPYLQIKTWATGAPGVHTVDGVDIPGNFVLNVEYRNRGTTAAGNVQITGNFTNLSYLSSDVAATGTGTGPIVFNLGTVQPGEEWTRFQVFVEVTGGVTNNASATMVITSSPPENMGPATERTSTWSGGITGNGAWLTISKNPWTRHPVPGSDYVYTLNICNAVSRLAVDSTTATVTDTLPAGTTLVSWWAAEDGWEQVSASDQLLVISRPSIASRGCTEVYVRVTLDAGVTSGTQLCNHAVVTADNHTVSTQNSIHRCHTVGAPRNNLAIHKEWASGMLVPGGHLVYNVMVHNTGNQPVTGPIIITDTLPAGTTFRSAQLLDNQPYTPTLVQVSATATQVVWQLNETIDNGYWTEFQIVLDVDETVAPGTVVENVIAIGRAGLVEYDLMDNVARWSEQINPSGPNLRVLKTGTWNDWGIGTRHLSYEVRVQNVGDERVYDATVTDTFASPLTRDLSLRVDPGFSYSLVQTGIQSPLILRLPQLEPGDDVGIYYGSHASEMAVASGLTFTNTAEVTLLPRDTAPEDNVAVHVASTGPDLAVTKELWSGLVEAGEVLTYRIAFGNLRDTRLWWWGMQGEALITDTLPDGMTFLSAELCNPRGMECTPISPTTNPDGSRTWNVGALGAGDRGVLRVVAQLPADAGEGDPFINEVEIASTMPGVDVEAFMDNNVDQAIVVIGDVTYLLTYTVVGQGTVTVEPDLESYEPGTMVTLTATPAQGWTFAGWSGDTVSTETTVQLTILGDTHVIATFVPDTVLIYLPIVVYNWGP